MTGDPVGQECAHLAFTIAALEDLVRYGRKEVLREFLYESAAELSNLLAVRRLAERRLSQFVSAENAA